MSSVDDRIVNMQFNNKQFTQGVTESQRSLEGLEQTLAKTASGKGMEGLATGVEQTTGRFKAMEIAGVSAIATLASKATMAGVNLVKSMTLDPIIQGFHEYEKLLTSTQTIVANTGVSTQKAGKYLTELNTYSDETIYNFGQMADSIGRFTAAGVSLPKATVAIKGMANAAALSGASTEQLNSAMYQVSQALSTGTIKLMDWNSIQNASMGGENIQNALKATATTLDDHGAAMDAAIEKHKSFRDSLTEGWLTADVFTKTMKVMAGTTDEATGKTVAFSEAQLVQMGYSKQQAKELNKLSAASIDSATKIKTFTQLLDVVKESIGSGWSNIFKALFGDLEQSKKIWTSVGNTINGALGSVFGYITKVLDGWRAAGGFEAMWAGFANIFKAIGNILKPFVAAFQAVFPATGKAGEGLASVSKGFESVTHGIEVATRGLNILTPVLTFLFGIVKMGAQVIGALFNALKPLAPEFQKIIAQVQIFGQQGQTMAQNLVQGFLGGLDPSAIMSAVASFAQGIIDTIKGVLGISSPSTVMIKVGYDLTLGFSQGIMEGAKNIGKALGVVGKVIFDSVRKLFAGVSPMEFTSFFNALLTGSILLTTKKVMSVVDTWKGIGNNMQGIFDGIGDSLKAWQNSLKSKMIMEIAIAIGILTASIIALSFIDPKKIAISLAAITTMMGQLAGIMFALSKIGGDTEIAILATSIVLISGAMVNLALAITILGQQDPEKISQGLAAMAIALALIVGAVRAMSGITGQLIAAGAGMVLMAVALNIMAGAVLAFGKIDPNTLSQGLGAVAIAVTILTASLSVLAGNSKGVLAAGASMVMIASAMVILSGAIFSLGKMDPATVSQGMVLFAISLALLTGALLVLGGNVAGVLGAATAMVLMAVAMNMIVSVILLLGTAPWEVVAKGMGFVALGLGILLLAALGAMEVAPGLIVLGQTFLMLGAALALAGIGMALFGTGFALLAATGTAGVAVLIAAFQAFMALLPSLAEQLALAFVAFFKVLANASDELRKSFGTIFKNILGVITDSIPEIQKVLQALIDAGIRTLRKSIPQWIELGWTLIDRFLKSMSKHIPQIADSVLKLIEGFIRALDKGLPRIIRAGTDLVVHFLDGMGKSSARIADQTGRTIVDILNGIRDAINTYAPQIRSAGLGIATAIIDGMTGGLLTTGLSAVRNAATQIANALPGWMRKVLGIGSPSKKMKPIGHAIAEGLAKGIEDGTQKAVDAAVNMANAVVAAGSNAVLKAQKTARAKEASAAMFQARADIKDSIAAEAEKAAKKNKKNKELQKKAQRLRKDADKAQQAADKKAAESGRAAEAVQRAKEFEEADLAGKGDIRRDQATALASRANQLLARSKQEMKDGKELRKKNKKLGQQAIDEAKADRTAARNAAIAAQQARNQSLEYYRQNIQAQIDEVKKAHDQDAAARKAEAEYEAATTEGKIAIMQKRKDKAEKDKRDAEAAYQKAIRNAQAFSKTDAKRSAQELEKAKTAADAAQKAADDAEQAQQTLDQLRGEGGTTGGGGTGEGILPSRSVLEDAARIVDRYSASLAQATAAAGAEQAPVQYVQNNYSPEALSASEIYRNSKNLLSAAELKMGVATSI